MSISGKNSISTNLEIENHHQIEIAFTNGGSNSAQLVINDLNQNENMQYTLSAKALFWEVFQITLRPGKYAISLTTSSALFYVREIKVYSNEGNSSKKNN